MAPGSPSKGKHSHRRYLERQHKKVVKNGNSVAIKVPQKFADPKTLEFINKCNNSTGFELGVAYAVHKKDRHSTRCSSKCAIVAESKDFPLEIILEGKDLAISHDHRVSVLRKFQRSQGIAVVGSSPTPAHINYFTLPNHSGLKSKKKADGTDKKKAWKLEKYEDEFESSEYNEYVTNDVNTAKRASFKLADYLPPVLL